MNREIPKNLIKKFCQEANGGVLQNGNIGIGNLVRYICDQNNFDLQSALKDLAQVVGEPVYEFLE